MSILLPHILVFLSGLCVYPLFLRNSFSLSSRFALFYLCGELVLVSYFVLSSLLFGSIFWNGAVLLALFGLGVFGWISRSSFGKLSKSENSFKCKNLALCGLQLLLVILNFANFDTSFLLPAVAWDARSIWLFHGKIFYYANSIDINTLKNPAYLWSHPDYPPFIPVLAAFHSQYLAGWSETLSKSFLFVHWVCCSILFAQMLFSLCGNIVVVGVAALFVQLVFSNNSHIAYADSCCAMALCLAVIGFALDLSEKGLQSESQRKSYWIGICCLALAALMKNEGLVFGAIIYLGHLAFNKLEAKSLAAELRGLFTFLVLVAPWNFLVWYHEVTGEYSSFYLSSGGRNLNWTEISNRTSTVIELGTEAIVQEYGASAILIVLLAIVVSVWRQFLGGDRVERYLLSIASILILMLLPIYLLTPLDLAWHIQTSFARVASVSIILSCVLLCRIAR